MKVFVPRLSGFCPGVKRAEKKLFEEKNRQPDENYFVYGFMINNRKYIEYLEKNNIRTVDAPEKLKKGDRLVIRTHGIKKDEENYLKKHFSIIDLTCGNVKRIQLEIQKYASEGYFTLLVGKRIHPEIKGLVSYAGDWFIAETGEDIDYFIRKGDELLSAGRGSGEGYEKILVVSQTTGNKNLFDRAARRVRSKWGGRKTIKIFNSICPVTVKKEKEALRLQEGVDISFVVGDRLSSNASKLFATLAAGGRNVHFIEDAADLKSRNLPLYKYKSALVVSSASTPGFVEEEVIEYLEGI